MKLKLTEDDVLAAVWGGAILGGGGGGFTAAGERTARLAVQVGAPELWTVDEFADEAITATVAYVGAPGAPELKVLPVHFMRAVDLLRKELPASSNVVALHSNENGAETTVNGWIQSALTGLPVLDLACNGRAHPSSLMGAMGLHLEPGYVSLQTYAGGSPERYIEGLVRGTLDAASNGVRHASVQAGGAVAVARNPVTVGYARQHGAPGAISQAIALGRVYLGGGLDAVARHLGGQVVAEGVVRRYRCEQIGGLDIGSIMLDDAAQTELPLINEYMLIEQGGRRVGAFPDLITTFSKNGHPMASAQVREGDFIRVLLVPRASLLLSRTMDMAELYAPLETLLNKPFAPVSIPL